MEVLITHHTFKGSESRSLEPKIRRELAAVRRRYQMQRKEAGSKPTSQGPGSSMGFVKRGFQLGAASSDPSIERSLF